MILPVLVDNAEMGTAEGKTTKVAKEVAARAALTAMGWL